MSLEEQARQTVDTLVGRTVAGVEQALRDLAAELTEAAALDRREAVERATEAARAEATRQMDDALAQARADLLEAQAAARAEAERQVQEALAAARADADAALEAARIDADRRVEDVRTLVEAATVASMQEQLEAARAEAALAAEAIESARRDVGQGADALAEAGRDARAGERDSMLVELERLRDAVVTLDQATSLKECLDRLSDAVAAQAPRFLLLVARGSSLRGWRTSGFDAAPAAESILVSLEAAGPLRDVAERGQARPVHPEVFGHVTDSVLAFARSTHGRVGLAVPVCLGGRTVAVLYADDAGASPREVPGGWPEALEILARHTSRCLEALTAVKSVGMLSPVAAGGAATSVARTSADEASGAGPAEPAPGVATVTPDADAFAAAERYARLVVSEIKLYNEAAIRVARHKKDIRMRLRAEIDRARRMFEERVPESLPGRDALFEQEVVRILADGQPELLGADTHDAA